MYGSLAPKRYRYRELKKITRSFREKLGKGGFGTVYKGCISDNRLVAVKILHSSTSNVEQFLNEVASISRTSHVNVVSLLGFCFEGPKQALVYEYMPNGSLDRYIYPDATTTLGWDKLYGIAIGVARGLEYLHQGCNTHIVHFDIKPQNILLDEDFRPKIADFGLAKLCPPKESIISMAEMRGTIGFIAPEVFSRNFGVISTKSDVYGYGMMLLQIVGGRRNVGRCVDNFSHDYFPHWIYHCLLEGGEIQIDDLTPVTEEIARKIALVGLWCIQTSPSNRPSMGRVVEMLERNLYDLDLPPKPYLDSAPGSTMSQVSYFTAYLDSAPGLQWVCHVYMLIVFDVHGN
ncbi:Protein kinase family protein [Rhynchospora pubera]|uniref:non-specific serine/threonine protein kinase n=1 Tax=Rhynchospora pubera TaxID=906938 RepID=A0AAV8HL12_9POAL|nr:Protein kinase family protein [Rhynchospora pubera]